jgi:hypothetical protein
MAIGSCFRRNDGQRESKSNLVALVQEA